MTEKLIFRKGGRIFPNVDPKEKEKMINMGYKLVEPAKRQLTRDELKKLADEKGIQYANNISTVKLAELVEQHEQEGE
jgi:hypothetical protein